MNKRNTRAIYQLSKLTSLLLLLSLFLPAVNTYAAQNGVSISQRFEPKEGNSAQSQKTQSGTAPKTSSANSGRRTGRSTTVKSTQRRALSDLRQVTLPDLVANNRPTPRTRPEFLKVRNKPVVVVAFPDEATQENAVGRIAYFTERSRGSIVSQQQLQGFYRQGNNQFDAHDFHAQGLASFYNAFAEAQKTRPTLQLTTGEEGFRDQLVRLGILQHNGNSYSGGDESFAVVSYPGRHSASSYPGFMKLIIEHEYNHAIFYTNSVYRQKIEALWNGLSPSAQQEILSFLNKSYDTRNKIVKLKEFAAYYRDYDALARFGQSIVKAERSGDWNEIQRAVRVLRQLDTYYDRPTSDYANP